MGKKKETVAPSPDSPEASISRITTRGKSSAPRAARKKSRLTDEAVADFVMPALPAEVPPPEASWSPVETIHLEELVVEEIQIEESVPAGGAVAAAAAMPRDPLADVAWLPPRAAALVRFALARMNRGLVGRLVERGMPYGERLLNRAKRVLARFGW
jgi:hypothetical protein